MALREREAHDGIGQCHVSAPDLIHLEFIRSDEQETV